MKKWSFSVPVILDLDTHEMIHRNDRIQFFGAEEKLCSVFSKK